jgi:hypothetical protein
MRNDISEMPQQAPLFRYDRRGSADHKQSVMRVVFKDGFFVFIILMAAYIFAYVIDNPRIIRYAVFIPLCIMAYIRPCSAFYSVLGSVLFSIICKNDTPITGELWLGGGTVLAGLVGSVNCRHQFRQRLTLVVGSSLLVGHMLWTAYIYGVPEDYFRWLPSMTILVGLVMQFLVRNWERYISAWFAIILMSSILTVFVFVNYYYEGAYSIHDIKTNELVYISDPNYLAMLMGLGCIPSIWFAQYFSNRKKTVLSLVLNVMGGFCFCGIIFSASRGVAIATITALLFILKRIFRRINILQFVSGAICLCMVVFFLLKMERIQGGKLELFTRMEDVSNDYGGSRISLAIASVELFEKRPFSEQLIGRGPYSHLYDLGAIMGFGKVNTHNMYLEYLLDYGVIGLGLLLYIFYIVASRQLFGAGGNQLRNFKLSMVVYITVCGLSIIPFALLSCVLVFALVMAPCDADPIHDRQLGGTW